MSKGKPIHVELVPPLTQQERAPTSPLVTKPKRITGTPLQRRRERWMQQHGPLCVLCQRKDRVRLWTQLDHVIPLHKGGVDDETNLQGLCDECHYYKTMQDKGIQGKHTTGADGWPVPRDE